MIFDLVQDFAAALEAMPDEHPRRRILALLDEAIRRDVHFIDRHPTTLFQCLWNSCWWYDCPAERQHDSQDQPALSVENSTPAFPLLEAWQDEKEATTPGYRWLRSLRPPLMPVASGQQFVLRGHAASVTCVAVSHETSRLVSGSEDGTVRVWDSTTGALIHCLAEQAGVEGVATSDQGRRAALASGQLYFGPGSVRVWDVDSGIVLCHLRRSDSAPGCVAFSPDARFVASGWWDQTIRLWNIETAMEVLCLRGHENGVTSLAYAPDGSRVVSSSTDKTVRIWNVNSGLELLCLRGHTSGVYAVRFFPDGRHIASASLDGTVRIWDTESGAQLHCLDGHSGSVRSLSISKDGRRLASSGERGISIWDTTTGAELHRREWAEHVTCVTFLSDGVHVAVGFYDKTLRILDPRAQIRSRAGHSKPVTSIAFSSDGKKVASASLDGAVRVCGTENGKESFRGRHNDYVWTVAFSPDGGRLLSGSSDRTVRCWDLSTGTVLTCLVGHLGMVLDAVFTPDGLRVLSASWDETVRIWDAASGLELDCFGKRPTVTDTSGISTIWPLISLAVSPDGRHIAMGEASVRIWDVPGRRELWSVVSPEEMVVRLAYSKDGERLAAESGLKTRVRMGDTSDYATWLMAAADGTPLQTLQGATDVRALADGPSLFPFRAIRRGLETVIETADDGTTVGWHAVPLNHLSTHPSGRIWAGAESSNVVVLKLEGWFTDSLELTNSGGKP